MVRTRKRIFLIDIKDQTVPPCFLPPLIPLLNHPDTCGEVMETRRRKRANAGAYFYLLTSSRGFHTVLRTTVSFPLLRCGGKGIMIPQLPAIIKHANQGGGLLYLLCFSHTQPCSIWQLNISPNAFPEMSIFPPFLSFHLSGGVGHHPISFCSSKLR